MNRNEILSIVIVFMLLGCNKDSLYDFNPNYNKNYLAKTVPLDNEQKLFLNGIMISEDKNTGIGNQFVFRSSKERFSIFSNQEGIYAVMDIGVDYSDSSIKMAGYWRSPLSYDRGQIYLQITKENGARGILKKQRLFFKCTGNQINLEGISKELSLDFSRGFSQKVLTNPLFSIIAHRGGGRNSDNIPFAENSLELIKHASDMGASGVEIDVKLTKDNVPIIYHDDDINIRLTQKSPLIGAVEDYNWDFLQKFVKLVDGQTIPTLEEALTTILDSTDIRVVWLDNKGGNERFFSYTFPVMYDAIKKSKTKGRTVLIINGIPTEEVASEYIKVKDYKERPSLCEISLARTKELGSDVYAPRWTLGTLDAEVAEAHASNIKVVTWTIDINTVMRKYLKEGSFDGILTNYPSILAYEFYTQE